MKTIIKKSQEAKKSSIILANASSKLKNKALLAMAKAISRNKKLILKENKKDLINGERLVKEGKLTKALLDRLNLNNVKINEIVKGIKSLVKLDDLVGKTISCVKLDRSLELYQVTCSIGVIGAIFESRPDVLAQISALCLKSGNSVLLKGGSEAKFTNRIMFNVLRKAAESVGIARGFMQLLETREEVKEMLKLDEYIDLIIPRGSNKLVKYIKDNTRIMVLGHDEGICHIYVDKFANLNMAVKVCFDAKTQYAAVCNAMETMLVHKDIAKRFLSVMIKKFIKAGVELRLDDKALTMAKKVLKIKDTRESKISSVTEKQSFSRDFQALNEKINKKLKPATQEDWKIEYNDLILSVKIVDSLDKAIDHINTYGSRHTDSIITKNKKNALKFLQYVDSSCVFWNCSTRFSDGYRFGKGAEVGISTNKVHARGPVGLEGLVIYKYYLMGNGQIVAKYTGKNARKFLHKKLNKQFKKQ